MITVDYDGEYKGNVYRLYGDGWYCCESKSDRYRWMKPCVYVQTKLYDIADARGYSIHAKPKIEQAKKEKIKKNKDENAKAQKVSSKTFISLF